MVLSEAEKQKVAEAERTALARKKAEQKRILAEAQADRDYYNSARSSSAAQAQGSAAPQKLLLRIRYDVDGQKGRRPVELTGTTATASLFHLYQATEEQFSVPPSKQVLRPADESKFPVAPHEERLPPFGNFASIEEFPSLETLGLRNGQELFLTAAAAEELAPPPAPAVPLKPAEPEPAPARPPSPPPAPAPAPQPAPKPAPAPTPAPAPSSGGGGGGGAAASGVQYSDTARMKFLWRTLEEKKLALTKAHDAREMAEVDRVRANPETARLTGLLLWSKEELETYCRLRADLNRTVGLEPVKEFIVQRLRDAAGRHVLKEGKQPRRHVLISGAFGVGKRHAAEMIGRLFALLSSQITSQVRVGSRVRLAAWQDSENRGALISRNDVGVVTEQFPPGNARPFRVQGPSGRFGNYREEELVAEAEFLISLESLSELVDKQTGKVRAADRTCYYLRLASALSEADAGILESVTEFGSIVVMAGSPDIVEANMQLSAFRRKQPELLSLPTLTATDIARLIAAAVEKKGYVGVGEGDVGTPELVTVLEHIVRQRFDETLIREKNGHLAQDILELAISRKNDRTWEETLDSAERFRLTPMDFGLDVLTAEQRQRRLEEVEAEVAGLVGWGSEDAVGTPKQFFATLQKQQSLVASGESRSGSHLPRGLWVTARPGSGRDSLARLAARSLRACGAISRDDVVWVEMSELVSTSASASSTVSAVDTEVRAKLLAAKRGCLAIRDVDELVESREALKALLSALETAEGSTLIMLFGAPSGMSRIARIEPGLEARFPTRVAIPDFLATELVDFIERSAGSAPSGAVVFEVGLAGRLVTHINEIYGGGIHGKELGERGANLPLARQLLARATQNRITRLFNRIQEGERPGVAAGPEQEAGVDALTAADFEIGAPLGTGIEQKAQVDEEVNSLIGMTKAKEWFQQVRQKVAFVEQTGTRSDLRVCLNLIITGNPGTGKTTFARLLAKFFHTYGVLTKDSFVEKNGLELKAEYMGGTAPRVKAAVQEAMGGCLFLDEAYALVDSTQGVGSTGDTFSQEAMRTLLTEVENYRTNLMVVLAGYRDKMSRLMRAEEGLARRFPGQLHLDDYTPDELAHICEQAARTKHQREFEPGLREKLARHIENFYWRDIAQSNAGFAVNLTERALDRQIVRIVSTYPHAFSVPLGRQASGHVGSSPGNSNPSADSMVLLRRQSTPFDDKIKDEVSVFTAADFGIEERPTLGDPELREKVQKEVDRLSGMANVKHFFQEMARTVTFVERGGDPKVLQTSLNLQLTGNPGTGKTTVARLIARYLYAHGVLPRENFVERNALMLKGQFVGQSAPTVVEAVRDAMGGCLFIDEAYALVDRGGDKFSGEVVRTLLTEVENHRTGLLVVLAGYADKMETLMDADPGLRRRFSTVLQLRDYTAEELAEICEKVAADRLRLTFAPGLQEQLAEHIRVMNARKEVDISQHNGGLAVTLAERAFRRLATRLGGASDGGGAISGTRARELIAEDFEIGKEAPRRAAAQAPPASEAANATAAGETAPNDSKPAADASSSSGGEERRRPAKRGRPQWHDAVDTLARSLATELLRGMKCPGAGDLGDEDPLDENDDSTNRRRSANINTNCPDPRCRNAVAKAMARVKERTVVKDEEIETEQLPVQEGERVVEEISTLQALDCLGVCPANFEWFELNVADPPDANCGICHYRLSDGYRCGGGTHYVCMGCIDAYKHRQTDF